MRSRGITLATRRGTAVAAPASGKVLFAGPFRDYGGVIIIDHGGGWKSVLVNAGSRLERGAAVGIGERIGYRPGQFAQLKVPGTEAWRSYSYANLANADNRLEFIVRDGRIASIEPSARMSS